MFDLKDKHRNALYFLLTIFAVYLTNSIYGKFLLIPLIIYFFINIIKDNDNKTKFITCVMGSIILSLSCLDKLFLVGFPILLYFCNYQNNKEYMYWFLNTLLIVATIENLFFSNFTLNVLFYFWGLPIICLSYVTTLYKKQTLHIILNILLFVVIIMQIAFLFDHYEKTIYTHSKNKDIVANYTILNKYYDNVININGNNAIYQPNSTVILPICENPKLDNKYKKGNTYILLAEHDNLNNFLIKYPYFNNDKYFRKTPWVLYSPTMISSFRYVNHKDIFYCSNLGSTVKFGYPLIWDYTWWGKPILLATFTKINGSNIYLFGDSDPFVNKLLPYNINLISLLLNRCLTFYPLFIIVFIITNILIFYKKLKYALCMYILMSILYFIPPYINIHSEINLYSQIKYLTAHEKSYPSSVLSRIANMNTSVLSGTKKTANVIIVDKKLKISKNEKNKIFYLMPNSYVQLSDDKLYCTGIKTGTEIFGNNEIINSNLLMLNQTVLDTAILKKADNYFVCSGSPQLNEHLTRSLLFDEK